MLRDLEAPLSMARETEARLTLAQARIVLMPARIRIMRALAERRSTVSELSRRTGIPKSTVLKHLRVLKRHGLLVRNEADRLWKPYELTRAGRAVGRLDPLRIVVLFALAAGAALLGAAGWTAWEAYRLRVTEEPWELPPIGVDPVEPAARVTMYALAAGGAVLVGAALLLWSRARLPRSSATEASTDTSSSR